MAFYPLRDAYEDVRLDFLLLDTVNRRTRLCVELMYATITEPALTIITAIIAKCGGMQRARIGFSTTIYNPHMDK